MEKHVLIIENKEKELCVLKEILMPHYSIDIVESVRDAEKTINKSKVDLILIDLDGIGGEYDDIKYLKKSNIDFYNIPVIFLVDTISVEKIVGISENKGVDIILKPLIPEIVLTRVKIQLELSACRMNVDKILKEKTEVIENLQDVMLMSMAELVEYRDENTGGHIKRTAKYVEVLVKALVEKNIYRETLSDDYIRDMIRSAPLHDIGKIGIDDKTLLKNGSLDEEEFEFMKTHASLGGSAIEKMIEQTTEGSFLDIAKDMARYHHEKWNGTGYPDGLKGEEIPVSARIMAIADVYDALATKRPYKNELNHEKVVEYIMSERGISFDPVILDVFEDVHPEFNKIREYYKSNSRL